MFLSEKMENAMKLLHERMNPEDREEKYEVENDFLPVEKGDVLAMLISAFITILPFVAIMLLLLVGVSYLLFLH